MNKFVVFLVAAVVMLGCQKQQTEAERNAEVEREVQARLAAERQAAEQQRLAQRQDELDARLRALNEKERSAETPAAQEPATEAPSAQVNQAPSGGGESYSLFYTRLDPYGTWVETPTYGYVWQPSAAIESRTWRPYTNGHWVYTDAGWMWISEEPFGWATYHYGRWTRLRGIGWVWVPGHDWAPAWVSWRVSNDYVGWAPLPPEAQFEVRVGIHNWADNYYDIGPEHYCFVPAREIGAERVERVVVPSQQNLTIVNQTTNVTNITYNNTVIVNQGPNYDELRTRSQKPIQRLRIERRTTGATETHAVVKGETVEVSAPVMASAQQAAPPPVVKKKVTQTEVEHGWEGVTDQKAMQQARAKIKSEATAPPNAPPKTFAKPAPAAAQPRAASPAPRTIASPAARSTITPAQPAGARPPVSTPTPPPVTRLKQTPLATATPAPRATPPRHPLVTGTPAVTPTPRATATPSPISTPMPTPPPPAFGRAAETKEQRRSEKELRRQERAERKAERLQSPAGTQTPPVAGGPPGPGKEHKKHKRPGELETSPTPTPAVSP